MSEKNVVLSCLQKKKQKQGKIVANEPHWFSILFEKLAKLTNAF